MTNLHTSKNDNQNDNQKSALRPWLGPRALLAVLTVAAGFNVSACACHEGAGKPRLEEPAFDKADLERALGLIASDGVWTPEKAMQFKDVYVRLPGSKRFEALRQLASAVNSKKLKVDEKQNLPF